VPALDYHDTALAAPPPLHAGLDRMLHGLQGRTARRGAINRELHRQAAAIHTRAAALQSAPDEELHRLLRDAQTRFRRGETLHDSELEEAFATIAEAARRQLGLQPYPVQIMGALGVTRGQFIEMATGEGKTLTVALAAVAAGWCGRPCHILTANDYLAARDADWLRPFYALCGLSVGAVTGEMKDCERRQNYHRDLTYSTAKEVLADFLRDRLRLGAYANATRRLIRAIYQAHAQSEGELVMRGVHTAIIDEADSALIDEAVTPLLISCKPENHPLTEAAQAAHGLVAEFQRGRDYVIEEKTQEITVTPTGVARLDEPSRALPGMWRAGPRRLELVEQALRAREFFHLGKQYVISEGEIVIVDESTGRLMPQRTWREGLHQAIEAKEGLTVTAPAETLARLSFQRFFRLYRRLSGLSGTAAEAAAELWHLYTLPVQRIPTHRPCIRVELPDRVFASDDEKWDSIVAEIAARQTRRQPVLVGTRSIAASEALATRLELRGIAFNLLNATRHRDEATIVSAAGEPGRITIATNMAGRGTDIKLAPGVAELGGLHVIMTERHESRRIDRQLIGRSARQGEPGSAQAFVSLDDELLRRHAPQWLRERARGALRAGLPQAERLAARLIRMAQRRSEQQAFRQRQQVLKTDTWADEALGFAGPDIVI
jgi:preprotein translocase subunit SecA